MKILARILSNEHTNNFVLDEDKNMAYELVGNGKYLFGSNGVFCQCFYLENSSWQAFSGRKFELPMKDGSVIKCHGQWFHGGASEVSKILGIEIIRVAIGTKTEMEKSYLLGSCFAIKGELNKLIEEYKKDNYGFEPLYPYWEYEKTLKCKKWFNSYCKVDKEKRHIIKNIKNMKK